MNRKLRNSLSGIAASGATLALALMVAVPASRSPVLDVVAQARSVALVDRAAVRADATAPLAEAVALSAEIAAASARAFDTREASASDSTGAPRKGKRHRRQTLVMPYFSFSPRG